MTKFEKVKNLLKTMDYELKGCFVEYLELDVNIEKNYTIEEYIEIMLDEWILTWIDETDEENRELYNWLKEELQKLQ